MYSQLEILVGMSVKKVELIHGYLQLSFDNDIILNIYNNYELINESEINNLNGMAINSVDENNEKIKLIFSNKKQLIIDLSDDAYNGPEALLLKVPGQPTMVWN